MKKILFTALMLAAASCTEQEPQAASPSQARGILEHMRFFRHPRAPNLCIGYVYVSDGDGNARTGGPAMVEVDCAKVERLLEPAEAPPPEAPR